MRKVLLFILSLFLLTGCAVPQEAMEENEKEDAAAVCSDDGTPKKWPTVWQETLDCGAHTCTFDASVEADDSARYFYYVYITLMCHAVLAYGFLWCFREYQYLFCFG